MYDQMLTWAKESDAVVPMCAFNTANDVATKCKLGTASETHSLDPITIGEKENQCVLFYQGAQEETMEFVSQGVDAIVKYGTYDVSTKIRGEDVTVLDADGNAVTINTDCFINKVVAVRYIAPPQEPEKTCNPTATLTREEGMDYDNGFTNLTDC